MRLLSLLALGMLIGCAHGKIEHVGQALEKGTITKDTQIYVEPISAKDATFSGDKSAESQKTGSAKNEIEENFNTKIALALTKLGYKATAVEAGKKDGIIITGKVAKVENGSAAARFFVGMGAGSANMYTNFTIVDRKKAKTLSTFEVVATSGGESNMGSYMEKHLLDGASKVAEFIDTSSK